MSHLFRLGFVVLSFSCVFSMVTVFCENDLIIFFRCYILLIALITTEAQNKSSISKCQISSVPTRTIDDFTDHFYECLIPDISSKCLGNVIRVVVGPLGRNLLDIAAVVGEKNFHFFIFLVFIFTKKWFLTIYFFFFTDNISIPLTKRLASQCGFSTRTDQQGNALILASIQNCFALNMVTEVEVSFCRIAVNVQCVSSCIIYLCVCVIIEG